ncbi:lysine-specific permease domain protein [Staphylococcus aureus]|nr:lysine-specific permease domain protein [Staphylococcus aureus]
MSKVQNESNNVVKRGLKDRHISMIAIGVVLVQVYL